MKTLRYDLHSPLAPTIARYVAVKRALGRSFDSHYYHLARLDRFLAPSHVSDLTPETFAAWCSSIQHLTSTGRRQLMRIVYHFCLFRRRSEPGCFVPDPSQFPPAQPRFRPYIFTEQEISRLLRATEPLRPNHLSPLHRDVARLAVVLLYTTGMRRGELVRLTLGDYDLGERVLLIRESKFHKSRILPLSADAILEVDRYLRLRRHPGRPCGNDAPLLLHHHGSLTGYTGPGLAHLMHKLFRQAGIRTASGCLPRVHDLRFSFAVHAMLRWYRLGVDVQARLPALSIYMGHSSVVSTQYYLIFVDTLAQVASARFETHCSSFLPTALFKGGAS
ncbi:MAG: tyrosine-type recombinase/integrase [Acidobacteria bacterium]|nr:tyrosine-type recombinase/integrase [Acidobacteriota bacterium]